MPAFNVYPYRKLLGTFLKVRGSGILPSGKTQLIPGRASKMATLISGSNSGRAQHPRHKVANSSPSACAAISMCFLGGRPTPGCAPSMAMSCFPRLASASVAMQSRPSLSPLPPSTEHLKRSVRSLQLHICASGPAGGMGGGSGGRPSQKVDTVGAKIMVGTAVTYMALIVIFPFLNVFIEVHRATKTQQPAGQHGLQRSPFGAIPPCPRHAHLGHPHHRAFSFPAGF